MTRLLLVNAHYYPDVHLAATANKLTDLAEYLSSQGYAVDVLTGPSANGRTGRDSHNDVAIHRVWSTRFGKKGILGRLVDYATLLISITLFILRSRGIRGIVFLTTPPLLPVVGMIVNRFRRIPYAVWSMDLHPDAEIAAGMLDGGSLIARLLCALNYAAYREADFVIALGS